MTYVITQPCCNDAACVPVCPVACIHPTPNEPGYRTAEMLYIDPDTCIECGACVDACPVDAIVHDYELSGPEQRFVELNAGYYRNRESLDSEPAPFTGDPLQVAGGPGTPLRVAVVGAGPAAVYAAEELLSARGVEAEVHVFERLPAPWGLVRYGVAPDHPQTKGVAEEFARTASRRGMHFHLNVEIGRDITVAELSEHFHAVIYAVGSSEGKRLGITGEDLPGSHPATEFVAWYNGHPDHAAATFPLDCERAVVIGNGNVALDVARILASDPEVLADTDLADHALLALRESRISEVVVLGRRGPAEAAYSAPELLGLSGIEGVRIRADFVEDAGLQPEETPAEPYSAAVVKSDLLRELGMSGQSDADRTITLRFLATPLEILGEDTVCGLRIARNEVVPGPDGPVVRQTDDTEILDCGLVLTAIGYRGRPVPGLPFDDERGIIPNEDGRVVDPETGVCIPGAYAAGWIKRGPSGSIGTNRHCSRETVAVLLDDYRRGALADTVAPRPALEELLRSRTEKIDYSDWKKIDTYEQSIAAAPRPRAKIVDRSRMLEVAQTGR